MQEAKANEAADKAKREVTEARNDADSLVYQCEKSMTDLGDKVSGAVGEVKPCDVCVCVCVYGCVVFKRVPFCL